MKVKSESEVAQSCPTLSDPMDCSLPGSSVHRIFQARVLERGAIAFSENGILLSNKKRTTLLIRSTAWEKSQKPYAKGKKSDTKDYILYESTYMTFWKGETMGAEIRSLVASG